MNTFNQRNVQSAVNAYAKAELNMLAYIVKHGAEAKGVVVTALESMWTKSIAPLYVTAFAKSGRYADKASRAVMVGRVKTIWLASASGLNVDTNASWAAEAKRLQESLKSAGTVKVTKRGTKTAGKVTAGKATNAKEGVAKEVKEAKAKSRRQEVKVYTPAQLLEAAFIVTGNKDLSALLVKATLERRDQLSKALRAICAE
jgi:hypothetical protein